MKKNRTNLPSKEYARLLSDLKTKISQAQIRAGLRVNQELILLYWQIGRDVLKRQKMQGWGAKVIDRLSIDLRRLFPQMKGFSSRNIKYMKAFAEANPEKSFVQQSAAQIPWFHHCVILDKIKNKKERNWYIKATVQQGWSRDMLVHQIEAKAFHRHVVGTGS